MKGNRDITIDHEEISRLMHESWSKTKRAQGFHGPGEICIVHKSECVGMTASGKTCALMHPDLIPWEQLPKKQRDINGHAFDAVLPYFEEKIREAKAEAYQDALQWVLAEAQACGCSERIAASIRACKEGG